MDKLVNYAEFHVWAEGKLMDVVANLSDEEYERELNGPKRSVKNLLEHWVATYIYFFKVVEMGPSGATWEASLQETKDLEHKQITETWKSYLSLFSQEMKINSQEVYRYPINRDTIVELNYIDYFLLITDHSTYHRGQLMSFLKTLGKEGVNTDYFTFIYQKYQK